MARKKKNQMEMLCENCKKPQQKDETQSTVNWQVFNSSDRCECGGKFVLHMDGEKL